MPEKKLNVKGSLDFEFVLESYGVLVRVHTPSRQLLASAERVARKALLGRLKILESIKAEHSFGIVEEGDTLFLLLNGEQVTSDTSVERFYRFFDSLLRITIAEHARDRVFVHAGVVGWKGSALVVPANSFRGKTTLVKELVQSGAEYYSDEYAVIDAEGLVHSFPRDLAVRYVDGGFREKQLKVEELGGKVGLVPIPIGLVLLTEFVENAVWQPEKLTVGQGIIEMIPHTIPRRFNPEFSLKVLNTAVSDAIILKSPRGDATDFAPQILSFFDNCLNLA